ncbi:pyridoxal phosphate-dependent aminotransferase [Alloiococcus sp. CFN-8]|uniref:pyridoxal phosphate-dependent aminotransferase n=1 Tax=Alloiococcus sp. CFN-8 TaxID=3416081 RepID=UPI003CF5AE4D
MIAERMKPLLNNNSAIRAMFEEGNRLKALYGEDKVYDFSLGNPNLKAPEAVKKAIIDILNEEDPVSIHGYMNNAGFPEVRSIIAASLNRRFGTSFKEDNILMIVGAASGLNIALKTILNPGDEVITFAPYFVDYGNYVANYDGKLVVVSPDTETFQPKLSELEMKITSRTKAVIINSPHNPTGIIYSEETIKNIAEILRNKEKEYKTNIVLISDEPYRELVYDGSLVPYITKYHDNSMVVYSYSKSLSLPGERIGYLVIPDELKNSREVFTAATIANRINGSVNAPSLMQKVIARCVDEPVDVSFYDRNRKDLYDGLISLGFQCIRPQGAFYLFLKSPEENEISFCEKAKKLKILMVPGSSFHCPGYVRLAYCVAHETIINSLPAFKLLAAEYSL